MARELFVTLELYRHQCVAPNRLRHDVERWTVLPEMFQRVYCWFGFFGHGRGLESRHLTELGSDAMARSCDVCGKGPQMGNRVQTRGKAKYLGGVGTKLTGITRRKFKPNLQKVRVTTGQGTNKSMLVCTQCLRSGAVAKRVKAKPFVLPAS